MSIATLARKTRAKRAKKGRGCFVLNMTGRGQVIGQSAKYGSGCKFSPDSHYMAGARSTCCTGNGTVKRRCREGCGCWHKGRSQPAPQMSYGVYNSRKSNGAYRPSGRRLCCKNTTLQNASSNNMNTWKRTRHYDASTLIEVKKLENIQCSKNHPRKPRILGNTCISNKIVAKPTARPVKKDCGCWLGLKIRGSLGYTRINHPKCPSTKASEMPVSAGEAVQKKKGAAIECNCPPHCPTPSESLTLPPEDVLYIRGVWEGVNMVAIVAPQMFSLVPGRRYKVINTTTFTFLMTWTGAGPAWIIRDCDKLGTVAPKSWAWLKIPKQTCPRPSYCLADKSGRTVEFKDERTTIYLTWPWNGRGGFATWNVTPCSAGYLFKKPVGNKGHCHSSEEIPCPTFLSDAGMEGLGDGRAGDGALGAGPAVGGGGGITYMERPNFDLLA